MDALQQRLAAKDYVSAWIGSADEKKDAQNFWRALLQNIYGIAHPGNEVLFEHPLKTIRPTAPSSSTAK